MEKRCGKNQKKINLGKNSMLKSLEKDFTSFKCSGKIQVGQLIFLEKRKFQKMLQTRPSKVFMF